MDVIIGPINKEKIILCSGDAGPESQKRGSAEAGWFFPGAKWVGAVRNAAERLGCRFGILTTGHGLVNSYDEISRYDEHISTYSGQVREKWQRTIPLFLGDNKYSLMVFYPGGCPRDLYVEILWPILYSLNISLITFGKPNMFDAGKIDKVVELIINGTTLNELKSILKCPEKLMFFNATDKSIT